MAPSDIAPEFNLDEAEFIQRRFEEILASSIHKTIGEIAENKELGFEEVRLIRNSTDATESEWEIKTKDGRIITVNLDFIITIISNKNLLIDGKWEKFSES